MSTVDAPLARAPDVRGGPARILIVRAPYYRDVVDGLTEGAVRILHDAGGSHEVLDVAGALELPQAIRLAVHGGTRFDGYVALGCVIRGETDHYEFVCQAAMAGLMQVAVKHGLATGNGLLTLATKAQADERSGPNGHNKGAEAAAAALTLVDAARRLGAA